MPLTVQRFALAFLATLIATGFLFLPASFAKGNKADSQSTLRIEIGKKHEPFIPPTLMLKGVTECSFSAQVLVSPAGKLLDYVITEATYAEFLPVIEESLPNWDFIVSEGVSSPIVQNIKLDLRSSGRVVSMNVASNIASELRSITNKRRSEYAIASVKELDTLPNPEKIVLPSIPQDAIKKNQGAVAIFDFVIDRNGAVRIPMLRETSREIDTDTLVAIQDAIQQWEFNIPTVDGEPVPVRVSQPITLSQATSLADSSQGTDPDAIPN